SVCVRTEMGSDHKVSCVLCQRSNETVITGPLSTKDQVTAHQNCLLFSSGLYCRNSPQFDDLFGFSVEDVMDEVKRGSKLMCSKCKKKGATAGCEVKRCKKSYHYPCAVEDGAKTIEDIVKEEYGLYCEKHNGQAQKNSGSVNGQASSPSTSQTSKNPSESRSSKVILQQLARLCATVTPTHPSGCIYLPSEEDSPSKRKSNAWKRRITDNSSDSEEDEVYKEMEMFAPVESDLDESANSVPESQVKKRRRVPLGPPQDVQSESLLLPVEICTESQSLSATSTGLPAQTESTPEPSVKEGKMEKIDGEGSSPEQGPVHSPDPYTNAAPLSRDHSEVPRVAGSPLRTSSAISPAPPETLCVSLLSSSPSPTSPPSEPEHSINTAAFWKSCNTAGCTQAIFTDFIKKMNDISSRIQSDQASQDGEEGCRILTGLTHVCFETLAYKAHSPLSTDYDLALKVMVASGKLTELVTKQQKGEVHTYHRGSVDGNVGYTLWPV
ncbi:hypothetical protein L3Q82_017610, partial [Scortum barcoo]